MVLRTEGEQRAYLDGYEMCSNCIKEYLSDEGKQKLDCLLSAVRNAVKTEGIESEYTSQPETEKFVKIREATPEERESVDKYIKSTSKPTGVDFWDLEQESATKQFAKWVAKEIFDDMWEYNIDSFAEIACRKLSKLGIVRSAGDEWELVDPQESEDI